MAPSGKTDAELVREAIAGNRDAFAEIVSRYQTLVCSLAYSATGDLARSEDLAQDTFFAVWRQLSELREPEKLRGWIGGIARHRIQDSIRHQYREPTHRAESLTCVAEAPTPEAQPSDQAVSADEAAILWRALEQIPESYREPLILFHRENQSVARVAGLMELSEDTVKQRLVRGRKMLQAEVETIVEGALRRTVPGRKFTSGVMAALPIAGLAMKTGTVVTKVTLGAGVVAKGTTGGGAVGLFATFMTSPLASLFIVFLERKKGLAREAAATSEEERTLAKRQRRIAHGVIIACALMLTLLKAWLNHQSSPPRYALLIPLVTMVPLLNVVYLHALRTRWRIWQLWAKVGDARAAQKWEFRSGQTFLGLPLLHVRLQANTAPVKAWIAVGNIAHGACFAVGTVAVAPVSLGIFSLGLISAGVTVAGGLSLGVQAAGIFAFGVLAAGWMAAGAFVYGFQAACGVAAYARIFAAVPPGNKKGMAWALHVNDAAAQEFFARNPFFVWTRECLHLAFHFRFLLGGLAAALLLGWTLLSLRQLRRYSHPAEPPRTSLS